MKRLVHYHSKRRCPYFLREQTKRLLLKRILRNQCVTVCVIIVVAFIAMVISWKVGEVQSFIVMAQANDKISTQAMQLAAVKSSENRDMSAELEAIKAKYPNPTQKEIEAYVKTIFGKDADVAIKVSHHECGPSRHSDYPACQNLSDIEDSIGLFQINLHNKTQSIHAGRIPGGNMTQKEIWLKNPFNNTLYAYWIFKTSGWTPWTSYTSGRYLN